MKLHLSWKCFAFLCLSLNAILAFLIIKALENECISNSSFDSFWRFKEDRTQQPLQQRSLHKVLSVLIVEFEEFENDIKGTILSVCERLPDANVVVVSTKTIYPPIRLPSMNCEVHFVVTGVNPAKSVDETRPERLVHTEYVLIIGDCTRLPQEHPLTSLKFKRLDDKNLIAIPVVNEFSEDFYGCLRLNVNLKEWTLQYSESNDQRHCDALVGHFAFLLKTSTLFQLNSPFLRPFQESLFIGSKLRNLKITVDEDTKFLRTNNLFLEEHSKWKKNVMHSKRLAELYSAFGIKKVIQANGEIEWYGCHKHTRRCFPSVINDTPDYLFEGKWTPPCCLHNLRITARHVFRAFETLNIRYWLEGGSLLGAARNGDIIPWDYDVDIGIYEEDIHKIPLLVEASKRNVKDDEGFVWEKAVEGDFYRVQYSESNRLHVDIFPFYSRNGTMTKNTWFENHRQDMEFPEHFLKPLSKLQFVGWNAFVPNNYIEFLEMKFGKNVIKNFQYPNPSMLNYSSFHL